MIRSLTIGLPLDGMSTAEIETRVRGLLRSAGEAFAAQRIPVRTQRFTLPALGAEGEAEGAVLSRLRWVDALARDTGVRWCCLPVDLLDAAPRVNRLAAALDAVGRFGRLFLNLILADRRRIAVDAAHDAATLVLNVARRSNNGFDNFRVGVSCNCPPNAPFFPFSRHEGANVAFSFALETAALCADALSACPDPHDLGAARDRLADVLSPVLERLDALGQRLAEESGAEYRGLDASLAPLPSENVSVAALIERLVGAPAGSHASLFATAFLTDAVRTALASSGARAVGFNGVMFSVLEDRGLAAANNHRHITVEGLLSLAAVCACGLDMIPVPGASFPEEIAAVALDVAALSCALDKPLGVRLLPIPNGRVNDFTKFNLDFLCDSRVMALTPNDSRFRSEAGPLGLRTPRS